MKVFTFCKNHNNLNFLKMENLNIYAAIMIMNKNIELVLVQKSKGNVLTSAGGVALYGEIKDFNNEDEKRKLFSKIFREMLQKNGDRLCNVSDEYISILYNDIISEEIKNSPAKFTAVLESLQEQGILFPRNLEILHHIEKPSKDGNGKHEQYFFKGNEYIFFEIEGGRLIPVYIEDASKYPVENKNFYCTDPDISLSHVNISIFELLKSFEVKGQLSRRYSRGEHRIALRKFIEKSFNLSDPKNMEIVHLLVYLK